MAKEISGSAMDDTTIIRRNGKRLHTCDSNHTLHYSIIRQRKGIRLPAEESKDHVNVLLAQRTCEEVEVGIQGVITNHLPLTSKPQPSN
jgi:hypothetical protein